MTGLSGSRTYRYRIWIVQYALLLCVIVGLEYLARSGAVGVLTLSPPSEMVVTLVELVRTGSITGDFVRTATAVLVAFALAVVTGIPIGWVLWRYKILLQTLDPYLVALYAMPIFVLYPMLIAIFGLGMAPIVTIAYTMGVIAIIINTANGFDKIKEVHRDVGRVLNLSRIQRFRHVYVPAATPYIFTGLKLGFVYSFIGVLASEFILANAGLGFLVSYSYNNFATNEMYAVILLVIALSIVINMTLLRIEKRLYYRRVSQ